MKSLPNVEHPLNVNKSKANRFWDRMKQQKYLYFMSVPFVIWVFVFSYVPLWGWLMAFQNYKPAKGFLRKNGSASTTSLCCLEMNAFISSCAIRWA